MVGKAYMLYVLGSFLFPTKKWTDVSVKYLSFFQDKDINKLWSWGAATLAHLYYSLGASSRVNAKELACCTTLLESWTKTTSALSGSAALNMFREALDSYKLQDVVWDPYLEKREDKHNFKEVASFSGLLCSLELNEPYNPDRVQRQFNRMQPLPRAPTFSFTKLCPDAVNLIEDDDYDDERVKVPHSQNEGGGGPDKVVEDPARSVLVEELATKVCTLTNFLSYRYLVIHILGMKLSCNKFVTRLLLLQTGECAFFMEANLRMQADIQAKDIDNSICKTKLNEKTLECESNKKLVEDLRMQLANKVKENEMLSSINDKLMEEVYVNQEVRLLPVSTIKGWDFEDAEDLTWEELSRQFTKLLTIAQEGPKGEYEDNIILSGRGEYQEMIDSRLKKIDHKTNLRHTLFQPFNWFQLDIRDVERDGNTMFRVAATYAYQSQIKFLNVKDSLCTLMTKKPSYWKIVFSQRLDVAYSDLGERSNKEALTFLPLFWQKAINKITKEKRFENILADSTKYWWVGMTSDKNFVKLKTKYQSPIPPVSTLWWEHVQLDIPDALVKPCVKNYFDAPNEAWMKLMRDNNVNLQDYNINDLFS
ncbi:hypothetical protein GIB67_031947 [Kingdonia uniflora]|uniref:Aminotransferase-like plant mobile domain-containing protein n=1 Tax=Kingdonia uniflora TaxID=39325 RepID=A0A7J7NTQ6_9MAGN|nr:hypothetical protein GIB67_031947 [Kingdonia uniflora]